MPKARAYEEYRLKLKLARRGLYVAPIAIVWYAVRSPLPFVKQTSREPPR